ncbi:hypothetical protein [Salegentibacter chungangensis]|uniref:Uncharacterized protein n=1 Tax=Salegentibacter chungangensis TaxID=1335724 RepID=A0ABW3NVK2_9FLAO
MQKDTTLISFLSISIAYTIGLLYFTIAETILNGRADDFGVIIFWSAIFEFVAWLVFLIYPLKKLNLKSKIFNPLLFPIISMIYLELVFILMIGWGFLFSGYYIVLEVAAVVGYSFGFIYVYLIKSTRFNNFIRRREINRLIILYPFLFIFLFLYAFPKIMPSTAFRFMPDEIQADIVEKTIPNFKKGDSFEDLDNSLPGYFSHIANGQGNSFASHGDFSFVIEVKNNKILRLEHSKQKDPDFTIYGSNN